MKLHVSGKLKSATAKQPSFKGFRIEALFDRKPVPTPSPSSTSRPLPDEVIGIDDASASSIETRLERAPDQIAPASATSTSVEPPISFRVSAVSDDAGNFTHGRCRTQALSSIPPTHRTRDRGPTSTVPDRARFSHRCTSTAE